MDFLEIRRKAKERAAARAAAAAEARAPTPATPPPGGVESPPVPAAARPDAPGTRLALDPMRTPAELPPVAPQPAFALFRPSGSPEESIEEATARIEQLLAASLGGEQAGATGFQTWRPGPAVPARAEPAPAPMARPAPEANAARAAPMLEPLPVTPGPEPRRTAPVDPLDDFFFREDEPGPDLGPVAPPESSTEPAPVALARDEYLTVLLGAEEYGIPIDAVREVMRAPPITEVPRAPVHVLGVITVRGEVVAVFDPRGRLGLPMGQDRTGGRVVIVDGGDGPCGLLVDGVASVVRLPRGSLEARPQGIGGPGADCFAGIGRDGGRLFTVLDVPALLRGTRRAPQVVVS